MTLVEIMEQSPEIEVYGGGQWAFYAVGCCWWTSFPEDLGKHPDGLPCCPHCGSVLLQGPLDKFVAAAQEKPEHYGPGGIETFVRAHHRNGLHGYSWDQYKRSTHGGDQEYYCPEHKFNPPPNSGLSFCPYCEFPDEMAEGEGDDK